MMSPQGTPLEPHVSEVCTGYIGVANAYMGRGGGHIQRYLPKFQDEGCKPFVQPVCRGRSCITTCAGTAPLGIPIHAEMRAYTCAYIHTNLYLGAPTLIRKSRNLNY